jgi:hypothetical protein
MSEKQDQPFQLSFNTSLKVDFQGSRGTPVTNHFHSKNESDDVWTADARVKNNFRSRILGLNVISQW